MSELKWLDQYSGETLHQLLAHEGKYRVDSLVVALEQAIQQKAARNGDETLSEEERTVLTVEALEREVNNGGYSQFFLNTPEFAGEIVASLQKIGCPSTAAITEKAVQALKADTFTRNAILEALDRGGDDLEEKLERCDDEFYDSGEDIASHLFDFIKSHQNAFNLG